ncbi:MAG TPA: thiamine pyrophosphate-dependent enzyme [Spirochaetia bacterium]|nr:thiamine pyrophosphate-dependent enzyme [Spirochaetia bacterium]
MSLAIRKETSGLVAHGVSTCAGCGLELAIRVVLNELGPQTIVVIPPGCAALFSGFGRETVLKIPGIQGNLGNTAAYAAGIRAGLEVQGREGITVLGFAGDGATVDIGLQSLSGALERGDHILYVCYDNEAYMNTGIQGSASTPCGAWTTTTPGGKRTGRKDMIRIAVAHDIPYVASASVGYVPDLRRKIRRARDAGGPAYIHIHAPCPVGWRFDPDKTVEVARLAVETHAWVLCEVADGVARLNVAVRKARPVSEYIRLQGRFRGVPAEEIAAAGEEMEKAYRRLLQALGITELEQKGDTGEES